MGLAPLVFGEKETSPGAIPSAFGLNFFCQKPEIVGRTVAGLCGPAD